MTVEEILKELKALGSPGDAAGMARFGINTEKAFGIRIPALRALAKRIGKDHALAQTLWDTEFHEARILASMIDDPAEVTEAQMEAWVLDFNSWDLCDQVCGNLFDKTEIAFEKAVEWIGREEEYVKRAGFAIPAWAAFHLKKLPDEDFEIFFPLAVGAATDERNFVKKAVSWALRNVGKRSLGLHARALETAREIEKNQDKTAQWIARDVIKELSDKKQIERLKKKSK
ncbi:DNA alkylation repair protein [Chloroflexota bacterium]